MIDLQPNLELTTDQAERLLEAWLGGPVVCSEIRPLEGGMVNTVLELVFDRPPHRAVVKLHGSDKFAAEARALEYLRTETSCPVPRVYLQDGPGRVVPYAFLLLERLPGVCLDGLDLETAARADLDAQLADVLGELHTHTGATWGRVGAAEGPAAWADHFLERLVEVRGDPALAERLAPDVLARVDDAIELAPAALRDAGTPTLVHGDVWDGNLMVHVEDGRWRISGLLDPDLQYADVEYELAYLEALDTPRRAFFARYSDHHPLRPGYQQRRLFYWLLTGLLHVALFGDPVFCDFTARTAAAIGREVS